MKRWTMALSFLVLALVWIGCDEGGDGSGGDIASRSDIVTAEDTTGLPDTAADTESQPDTPSPEDTAVDTGGGEGKGCSPSTKIGRFEILNDPMGSWVTGEVTDSVAIMDAILEAKESEGSCVLWMGLNPAFCDPQCVSGEECGEDGVCHPEPKRRSVGVVTVEGLKEPLEIEANYAIEYKAWDFVGAPYEIGADITLTASGDEIEGFSLAGAGVVPIVVPDVDWIVSPGQPLTVEWEPDEGPGEIWFELNVDQHGVTPVTLRCAVEDTGSYTVSAEMIQVLIDYGASGASSGWMFRRTIDSVQVAEGCVELEVYAWQQVFPFCKDCPCTTPGECPE